MSIGLDLPFFVAIDLFGIILLACVVPLEVAILMSRPLWIGTCIAWGERRVRETGSRFPIALRPRAIAAALAAAALAVAVSACISRNYMVWDRHWHAPQVTAIATQKIPFVNVFESNVQLRYHYASDVLAEVFRTLSLDVISANRAISLVHDATFGLAAAALALIAMGLGQRGGSVAALGGVLVLLHGPIPLHASLAIPLYGVMYPPFLCSSYRPHVALAGLFMVGFVGALGASALAPSWLARERLFARLVVLAAVMSLTDEASLALLDVSLGLAWLVVPSILGVGRARGATMLAAIGTASVVPSVLLGGSFARGGPVQKLTWATAQVPSQERGHAALSFTGGEATKALVFDLLPFLLGCAAIGLVLVKRPSRSLAAMLVFPSAVVLVCTLCATHVQINGQAAAEVQRFFVAPFFAVFVIALLVLSRASPGSLASVLILGVLAVPAVFSLYWLRTVVPATLVNEAKGMDVYLGMNCRQEAGAGLGDKPKATYVNEDDYFAYAGCRAIFSPGGTDAPWPTKVFPHFQSAEQLRELDAGMVRHDAELDAVCPARDGPRDPVCNRLLQHRTSCRPIGTRFLRCPLTPIDREELIASAQASGEPSPHWRRR